MDAHFDGCQLLGCGPLLGGRLCRCSLHFSVSRRWGLSLCKAFTRLKGAICGNQIRLCSKQLLCLLSFLLPPGQTAITSVCRITYLTRNASWEPREPFPLPQLTGAKIEPTFCFTFLKSSTLRCLHWWTRYSLHSRRLSTARDICFETQQQQPVLGNKGRLCPGLTCSASLL